MMALSVLVFMAVHDVAMLKAGEISREDYDRWRYRYPEFSITPGRVKPISQGLSDMLVDALKEQSE